LQNTHFLVEKIGYSKLIITFFNLPPLFTGDIIFYKMLFC